MSALQCCNLPHISHILFPLCCPSTSEFDGHSRHLLLLLHITLPAHSLLSRWWQLPYFWIGIKAYDFVAGDRNVKSSYLLTKDEALELFPMLRSDKLVGAIVYYDGQQDDARMNLAIALTAARHGAAVCNHIQVTELLKKKDSTGKEVCCGAKVRVSGGQ